MIAPMVLLPLGNCDSTQMVTAAAGMLPSARRPVIAQSICPLRPCATVPPALVMRRVEQVGADRGGRVDAEDQHQQRRHQRAAADAGQADDGADRKAGKGVEVVHGGASYQRPI
jgi:hypothetical protein